MSKLIQSHPKILGVCFLLTINGQMHQQFNTLADLITQPMMEQANCSSLAGSSLFMGSIDYLKTDGLSFFFLGGGCGAGRVAAGLRYVLSL